MAISSLNFIISQFETEKYRYFAIYDEDGDRVYFQNDLIDVETAINKLRNFFKDNQGYYTIRVFSKKLSDKLSLIHI